MKDNTMQSNYQLYKNSGKSFGIMNENSWNGSMKNSILNLDNHGGGSHWVSIKKLHKNHYLYDDSFGVRPPNLNVKNSIIEYDPYMEQKVYEKNCGKRAFNSLINHK
jgi:hypothetical protein